MKTIVIDPAHGGRDKGEIFQGQPEKQLNLSFCKKLGHFLTKQYDVRVYFTRRSDETVDGALRLRRASERKADFLCSIHHENKGGWMSQASGAGARLIQNVLHGALACVLYKKGEKKELQHSLWLALNMPVCILTLPAEKKRKTMLVRAVANGIAASLGLMTRSRIETKPFYCVVAGSFKNHEHAANRRDYLAQQQLYAFIVKTLLNGETYYRVYSGIFQQPETAKKRQTALCRMGLGDPFIITVFNLCPRGDSSGFANKPGKFYDAKGKLLQPRPPAIRGKPLLTAAELDEYARSLHPKAPKLGKYYIQFGCHYSIRSDIAFAQALDETNVFRFTGFVVPEQNFFAFHPAPNTKESQLYFADAEEGVLAHIQHLYALSTTMPLPEGYPLVDPLFDAVPRGSIKTWHELSGSRLTCPGELGDRILLTYQKMKERALRKRRNIFFFHRRPPC